MGAARPAHPLVLSPAKKKKNCKKKTTNKI